MLLMCYPSVFGIPVLKLGFLSSGHVLSKPNPYCVGQHPPAPVSRIIRKAYPFFCVGFDALVKVGQIVGILLAVIPTVNSVSIESTF